VKSKGFKKMSLLDLAAARVKNTQNIAVVKKGDLREIISPFVSGENFIGIVVKVFSDSMYVYHSDIKKTIVWNRRVKCIVSCI
jgi:hypothetical protein